MSSSPLDAPKKQDTPLPFQEKIRELDRLIDAGNSLSGHERNCMFLNTGSERFATISAVAGIDFADDGRAPAAVDWDHDGDLDLWISNRTAPMLRFLRNDSIGDNHWLALQLTGSTCNRDAVGARVTVMPNGDAKPIVKTLKAGEGFLSQSSKWLHFGLGDTTNIDSITIRWPDGKEQKLTSLATNQRYTVVQGKAPQRAPQRSAKTIIADTASPLTIPEQSDATQAVLGLRMPLPPLRIDGVDVSDNGATLINLWATWCAPCAAELKAFAAAAPQLKKAGVQIVPLAMDHLADPETTADPSVFLRKLGVPFAGKKATAEVVQQLEKATQAAYGQRLQLPMPASFLISARGELAAVYFGPVQPDRILTDAKTLPLNSDELHSAALPFKGQWFKRPGGLNLIEVPLALMEAGQTDDALIFVKRAGAKIEQHKDFAKLMTWIGDELMKRGNAAQALSVYEQAVTINDNDTTLLNNLAWQLAAHPNPKVRDGKRAVKWAEKAATLTDNKDPSILDTLAAAYAQAGDFKKAVTTAQRAASLTKRQPALLKGIQTSLKLYQAGRAQP
ncbi:MAG: ASPIC/UnbV domain-containing protein [Verrucomicrobiales bacterium]